MVTNHYPKLTALAVTFPTLRGVHGVEPFDAGKLVDGLRRDPAHTGASRHAVRFILDVFNGSILQDTRGGHFDVVSALGTWDDAHRAAFLAWARAPWWG